MSGVYVNDFDVVYREVSLRDMFYSTTEEKCAAIYDKVLEEANDEYQTELTELKDKIVNLEGDNGDYQRQVVELEDVIESLNNEIEQLELKIDELSREDIL